MQTINITTDVQIRWMIRRDMNQVRDIDIGSFAEPWTEDDFVSHLRERNCIGMIAEHVNRDKVVAFMVYTLHEKSLFL